MDTLDFLNYVLPEQGVYCLMRTSRKGNLYSAAYDDISTMAADVVRDTGKGKDVYFALASFKDKNGDSVSRTRSNARALQSLYLDIDAGVGKPYATWKDAARAVHTFILQTKLPVPMLVLSGHGIHVYWVFEEEVPVAKWQVMASRLKALCAGLNLHADPACTADSARILRPVGSANFKNFADIKKVRLLLEGEGPVSVEAMFTALETLSATYAVRIIDEGQDPTWNDANRYKKLDMIADTLDPVWQKMLFVPKEVLNDELRLASQIVPECQQIREAGKGSEKQWHNMICLLKCCHDGYDITHELSKGWVSADGTQSYDVHITDAKIVNSKAYPILCSTFDAARPGVCQGCKHYSPDVDSKRTPLMLGRVGDVAMPTQVTEAPTVVEQEGFDTLDGGQANTLFQSPIWIKETAGFKQDAAGIYKREKQEDGDEYIDRLVSRSAITPIATRTDEDGSRIYMWHVYPNIAAGDTPQMVEIPASAMFDSPQVLRAFASKGFLWVTAGKNVTDTFGRYCIERLNDAEEKGSMTYLKQHKHLGWSVDGEFVMGDRVITPSGEIIQHDVGLEALSERCRVNGDLDKWKAACHMMFSSPKSIRQAVMFMHAFGSPLMKFMGNAESTFTFVRGATGVGKTTTAMMMQSVWFAPGPMPKGLGSTHSHGGYTGNAFYGVMGGMHSLPMYLDEATFMDTDAVPDFVMDITSGSGKVRMTQEARVKHADSWCLMSLATSNSSLVGKLVTALGANDKRDATMARVVEFDLTEIGDVPNSAVYINQMMTNHGVAGQAYARALVANVRSGKLFTAITQAKELLHSRFQFEQRDRFWLAWATSLLVGFRLAKALGLVAIDADRFVDELVAILEVQKRRVSALAEEERNRDYVGELLEEYRQDIQFYSTKGVPGSAAKVKRPVGPVVTRAKIGWDVSTGEIRIAGSVVRRWCIEHDVDRNYFEYVIKSQGKEAPYQFVQHGYRIRTFHNIVGVGDGPQTNCYVFQTEPQDESSISSI